MATRDVIVDQKPMPVPPADPSVIIPAGVAAAAARADAYYASAPAQAPGADQGGDHPIQIVEAGPQPQFAPGGPVAPQPQRAAAPASDVERNYLAMKGRYDKEAAEKKELANRLNEMANTLIQTQQQLRQVTAPQAAPPQRQRLVTPEEERDFGPEFLTVVKKAAKEDIAPAIASLQAQVSNLTTQLGEQKKVSIYDTLTDAVPNWRVINKSPEFGRWLLLTDAYSGHIRQGLLTDAFRSGDAGRVLRFFEGFIKDEAAVGSAPVQGAAPGAPQPSPAAQRQAAMTLDLLAAPGRAQATPDYPSADSGKPTFTRADIDAFYGGVRKGVYRGREVEKDRLEREIFAAQREGRVR